MTLRLRRRPFRFALLRPLRTAHVVVTCRQPDTRDDDAATGYHAVRAAVYRLPDANSPAAKRVGASGGDQCGNENFTSARHRRDACSIVTGPTHWLICTQGAKTTLI